MKKILLLAAVSSLLLFSCKDDTVDPNGGGGGNNTAPTSYTQNSIIEYFSGAWCGYCPDGWLKAQTIMDANPNRVQTVVIHRGDGMENPNGTTIDAQYNKAGYPTGMVSRIGGTTESRSGWGAKVSQVLSTAAKCGLAISTSKQSDNTYKVKVKLGVGSKDLPEGSYKLIVYGVSKLVTGTGSAYDQVNYYYNAAQFPGHPFNNIGRKVTQSNGAIIGVIEGYEHKHVVNWVLSNALGDPVDEAKVKAGSLSEYEYSINPLGEDVFVVAMLYEQTLSTGTSFVHNAAWVDLGSSVDFK